MTFGLLMMEIDSKEIVEASCTGVGGLLHACEDCWWPGGS